MDWNCELRESAKDGDLDRIKECIKNGANVNAGDFFGKTALMETLSNKHWEIAKYLVENGADVNLTKEFNANNTFGRRSVGDRCCKLTALILASQEGHLEMVKLLVEHGAYINYGYDYFGETALMKALRNEHWEIVKYLVKNGADINPEKGELPLIWASQNGHLEIVKFLVENGADVNLAEGFMYDTAFSVAKTSEIKAYLMSAKDIDWNLELAMSILRDDLGCVKECLVNGADINAQDNNGWTTLMGASNCGHLGIVKCLIENGVDINVKNNDNKTALDLAKTDEIKAYLTQTIKQKELQDNFIDFVKQGDIEKIRECLASGVNINMVDSDGKTALMWACQSGHFEVAITLISSGADINAKDKNGKTALNYSAESGNVELMKLLLAQGADTGAKK